MTFPDMLDTAYDSIVTRNGVADSGSRMDRTSDVQCDVFSHTVVKSRDGTELVTDKKPIIVIIPTVGEHVDGNPLQSYHLKR